MKDTNENGNSTRCGSCTQRIATNFCGPEDDVWMRLAMVRTARTVPRGSTIFMEGQSPSGVFVLCSGRVKILTSSHDGRSIIVRVVKPGEVLGLSAALAGEPFEGSALAMEPSTVSYIDRVDLIELINRDQAVALKALQELGNVYRKAYARVCTLGLASSVSGRLARLLLELCESGERENGSARFKLSFTHEEIAEMIGTSRETVTRVIGSFRERGLIEVERKNVLHIPETKRLSSLAG